MVEIPEQECQIAKDEGMVHVKAGTHFQAGFPSKLIEERDTLDQIIMTSVVATCCSTYTF